jgi:Holliday junction resolvase RusA-like endonuclease
VTILRLYVAGTPRPQPRARFVNGRVVSTVSKAAKALKTRIMWEARIAAVGTIDTACGMRLTFHFPTTKRERWGQPHTCRPDVDNLTKLVMDALVKVGVLKDDSLVSDGLSVKRWAETGGVEILVYDPAAGVPVDDDVGAVEIVDNVESGA